MNTSVVLFARAAWSPRADPRLMNDTAGAAVMEQRDGGSGDRSQERKANTLKGMMGYVPHAERVMTVCLSTVGAFHRFKLGKQHTACLLNEDICSWNSSSWRWASQSVLSLIAGFSGLVCEADYTSNIQKTWQRIKPYTWRQTIKGSKCTRFMLFFQAKPLAKTVRTSVNNIRPIPHRKLSVIYHQTHFIYTQWHHGPHRKKGTTAATSDTFKVTCVGDY